MNNLLESLASAPTSSRNYVPQRFEPKDLFNRSVEDVFSELIRKGNGGTTVRSAAAPALSTQFVRSELTTKATSNAPGSFCEIIYPEDRALDEKHTAKHSNLLPLAYTSTYASGTYQAGFGERSAKALAREESTYQLKGVFPTAALSFAKLRARIEARDGDLRSLDCIFAMMWGLKDGSVMSIPRLHLDGSEATRMSAMEDRAYHALSGHPGHHGGYRVDIATLAPDSLGESVPINWARLRTGLKAIAMMQVYGDITIATMISYVRQQIDVKFTMGIVEGSQVAYIRPQPWEIYLAKLMNKDMLVASENVWDTDFRELGIAVAVTAQESIAYQILSQPGMQLEEDIQRIASTVSKLSNASLQKTIRVMLAFDNDRALVQEANDAEFQELSRSQLSENFIVPRYKLTPSGFTKGALVPNLGRDDLPDMKSHGKMSRMLDLREFREACLTVPLDIPGALNVAVYLTAMNPQLQIYAYMLMRFVRPPDSESTNPKKVAIRLRDETLYESTEVRQLGNHIFGDIFISTFELLLRNIAAKECRSELSVKSALWTYLSGRCKQRRQCPYPGGWKDLIHELRTCPEGWTLYYWVRVTIGRKHYQMTEGLLAPIAAGEVSDFLSLMKRSVRLKAQSWAQYYSGGYKAIEGKLEAERQEAKRRRSERDKQRIFDEDAIHERNGKYVPPHLRRTVDLEHVYNADDILNRKSGYTAEQYQKMVEMQSKSKFFAAINVVSSGSQITTGITDGKMLEMLTEFYQARWYSLQIRIEKAKNAGKVFMLGPHTFAEHPWGELRTDLPIEYDEMLAYMSSLDPRAWTIEPQFLQDKLRKSISELWADVSEEIVKVTTYIHDVCEGLAEEQEEMDAERGLESAIKSMIGTNAIQIPTYGYVPPYSLPAKLMEVTSHSHSAEATRMVMQKQTTYAHAQEASQDLDENLSLDELEDGDDADLDMSSFMMSEQSSILVAQKVEYMSIKAIWATIGLPSENDEKVRLALGAASDYDIDGPHLDDKLGPVMLRGEEHLVRKKWKNVESMITHRLGMFDIRPIIDDM